MSKKSWVIICLLIGSVIGGYIPTFFGASVFSFTSLITSAIGGIAGIWIGMKFGD
jgi:hypothetical protein